MFCEYLHTNSESLAQIYAIFAGIQTLFLWDWCTLYIQLGKKMFSYYS